jgi:hypothetical protein
MSTPIPFLPPVLATIDEMLTTKKNPALSGDEMETLCSHLYALRDRDQRIAIAEIAYLNHDDPQALNIFLACTIPMAERMAERKAERVFTHPTDWQLEAMYGGAVSNLINMFEVHRPLQPVVSYPFQRYLMMTIIHGAMNPFRIRHEQQDLLFLVAAESCRRGSFFGRHGRHLLVGNQRYFLLYTEISNPEFNL